MVLELLFQHQYVLFFSFVFALIFSLTFHEFGHAKVASMIGDDTAERAGRLTQESYANKTYSQKINGGQWSAIQITTAAGVCTMVDLMREGALPTRGFLHQEDVALDTFLGNRFGQYYA